MELNKKNPIELHPHNIVCLAVSLMLVDLYAQNSRTTGGRLCWVNIQPYFNGVSPKYQENVFIGEWRMGPFWPYKAVRCVADSS
ncbi:hypothetical protein CRM22_011080 [Opisthorchis felineus]|uniref:Uncharacterized protein n=1 Tax=Opisthorchis felineus TaxID=147828 RepID=A0A4S2KBS2_OPIFE|nr:hypothetical protein CRM22_011080 [Opisthorchis felineus]